MRLGDNPKFAQILQSVQIVDVPVTSEVSDNLAKTYSSRYTKPAGDEEAINELGNIFNDLMGYCTAEIRDGIGEYYRVLTNRQLPAFEWILEAFHVASKKEAHKRNFPYVVGMLRCWMKYGFGHIPSQEEDEVVSYFEEVAGRGITPQERLVIKNLMGTYGVIKVTRMIGELEHNRDHSMFMVQSLKSLLEDKFPEKKEKFSPQAG